MFSKIRRVLVLFKKISVKVAGFMNILVCLLLIIEGLFIHI